MTIVENELERVRKPTGESHLIGDDGGRAIDRNPGEQDWGGAWGDPTQPPIGTGMLDEGAVDRPEVIAPGVIVPASISPQLPASPAPFHQVGRLEVLWSTTAGDAAAEYIIQGRMSTLDEWTTLVGMSGNTFSSHTATLTELVSVRYVRLYIYEPTQDADNVARVREFRAFNALVGGTDLCVTGTASADTNDGNVPANAIDNNLGTMWQSTGVAREHWLEVDLGTPAVMTLATGADANDAWIDVTWPAMAGARAYLISYRPTADPVASARVERVPSSQLTVRLRNLLANTGYTIELRVENEFGFVSSSAAQTITTALDTGVPATPGAPQLIAGIKQVFVTWTDVADVDLLEYEVETATNSGFSTGVQTWRGRATIMVQDRPAGTAIWARVRSKDRSGNVSAWQPTSPTNVTPLSVGSGIGTGEITTTMIADDAITTPKIAANQVTAAKMVAGTITAASAIIADAAIVTAKIADLAVTTAKINDLAVTTAKINDLAVTNAKISALDAGKITTGSLDAARITAHSITVDHLKELQLINVNTLDPGFESGVAPSTTYPVASGSGSGAWTVDNTVLGRVGTYAAKYTNPASGTRRSALKLVSNVPVTPGDWWTTQFKLGWDIPIGTNAVAQMDIVLAAKSDTSTYLSGHGPCTSVPCADGYWDGFLTNGWRIFGGDDEVLTMQYEFGSAQVPAGAAYMDVFMAVHGDDTSANNYADDNTIVWFDDVTIFKALNLSTNIDPGSGAGVFHTRQRLVITGEGLEYYAEDGERILAMHGAAGSIGEGGRQFAAGGQETDSYARVTADVVLSTTAGTQSTVIEKLNVRCHEGRLYKVTVSLPRFTSAGTGGATTDRWDFEIERAIGAGAYTSMQRQIWTPGVATNIKRWPVNMITFFSLGTGADDVDFRVRAMKQSGAATVTSTFTCNSTEPCELFVEDVGPAVGNQIG